MEEIIKKLKQEIINHDLVKNSSLLGTFQWKRAQFIVLSDMISEGLSRSEFMQGAKKNDLGVTISNSTLQRIFTNGYTDRKSNDIRFLKTLDKLAIFLGYPNLNSFLLQQSQSEKQSFEKEKIKANEGFDSQISFFSEFINAYCQAEFEIIKKIPYLDLSKLLDYVFEDSPVRERTTDMITKMAERNHHLNCKNNRSNFEIYGFKLRSLNENTAVISTKEFWNMHWIDSNGKTTYTYNQSNNQLYFFRNIDDVWKIWDNHNPGYESLAEDFLKI